MLRPITPLLLVILLLSSTVGRAQQASQPSLPGYVMKRWGTAEGMPHNSASAIVQTRDGYLWIGTTSAGLVRFDGVTFKTFNILNAPGLPSDRIGALHEDADGTLWIGTAVGLVRYRDGVFTSERLRENPSENVIFDIRSDHVGRLWVVTFGRVIHRARSEAEWSVAPTPAAVWRLWPSASGTIWMATIAGLIEWRDGIVRTLTMRDGLPSDDVRVVRETDDGRVWIGTARGMAYLEPKAGRVVADPTIAAGLTVERLFEDRRGVLWVAAAGRLFARAPDGQVSTAMLPRLDNSENLSVLAFAEDREGHVWFGGQGTAGGVFRVSPARVTTIGSADGLPCDNIGAVTEAADGTIWIAPFCNSGRGLIALRDGKLTEYVGPTYIWSLLAEPDGILWVASIDGRLLRFDGSRFEEVLAPPHDRGVVPADIATIHRHDDGALWLGTKRGLARFQDGTWTHLRTADGLVTDDVRSLATGHDGSLWIGTAAGISRYHQGRFTSYREADGVPPGPIRALHVDAEGVVWLGAHGGGLARFKNGAFTSYGVRGGVLDSAVHRIIEDDEGFLWLPGDRGIRRVSKRDLNAIADGQPATLDVVLLNESDGMRSVECNGMAQPAGWRTRDGLLYFPTQLGIVRIDSARITSQVASPHPQIEEVIVDGAPLRGDLIVPAGARDIEVRYTAPAFARPELVQFRYQLEGYSNDWIEAGTRRMASFVNLRPGRYQLRVMARNAAGPWSEQLTAVTFALQPQLYQRPWFQIGLAFVIIASLVAAGRWYVKNLRGRAEELERKVTERTVALSVAHDKLSVANQGLVKANQQVEQAHGQVLAVLNQLDIGVLVLRANGTVRYASVSAQRLLDTAEQDLVGRSWSACLPVVESDRAQIKARIERPSRSGGRVPVQLVVGGKRYWAEIDVRDEPPPGDGRILYLYGVTEMSALPAGPESERADGLVGRSTAMHVVQKQIRDVARVDSTVLIEGETGVGKELVARAIHRRSERAAKPFIAVNAAGLSESILASQLFGHRRGAFTGAVDDQMGVFEAANGGTLFLDEIGDMPLTMQASLLRVLQEREITRLGDSHARRVDVRFIAATHRDLSREVDAGRFREDLLYRVRVATIAVPPLRERMEDVPLLVESFLTQVATRPGQRAPHVSRDAVDALLGYSWPGNVRELKAAIERALVRASDEVIRLEDLPPEVLSESAPVRSLEQLPADASERDRLIAALRQTGGNRKEAARLLGIGRTTLYKRLAEYGLDDPTSVKN